MKLIVENDFRDFELIIEQQNPQAPKFLKTRGPYIVTEKKNSNGRTYSKPLMEQVVDVFMKKMIDTGRAMGELNHPPHTTINYDRACHRIISLKQDNNMWIGESVVLCSSTDGSIKATPCGDTLASILQHGGKPGMSTRGVGEISEGNLIDKCFEIVTVDCVSDPSAPGAFVNGILESKNFMIDTHGDIVEMAFQQFENGLAIIPTHSTKTDEGKIYVESLVQKFLASI